MKRAAVILFSVAVLVIAGLGSSYKMIEFAMTIVKDDIEGFGVVAVAIYVVGMLPMIFLMMWALLTGKFRDIEAPKLRMLELDAEIERAGGMRCVEEGP